MKKCTYCGKEYPDEALVCSIDQEPLQFEAPTPNHHKKSFTSESPKPLKHSVGRPFWIGCLVGPVLFIIFCAAQGIFQDSFTFWFFACIAFIVFSPVGGLIFQVIHDLFVARRLRQLRVWDYAVFAAIGVTLFIVGSALFHTSGSDVDLSKNRTFDIAGVFVVLLILIYAISKNWSHFSSRQTMTAPTDATPALWSPNAAACWSLLFSPAFGAFLHARNADSLGRTEEAKTNRVWFNVYVAYLVFVTFCIFIPAIPGVIFDVASFGLLLGWYFSTGKKQIKFVKETWQDRYQPKALTKPLLIALGCWVGVWIVSIFLWRLAKLLYGLKN